MIIPTDILFDTATSDLLVVGGDLVIGDSTTQHQQDIILADKGHYHHAPALGVGINNYLLDETALPTLRAVIRQELERDGMAVAFISIAPDGNVQVSASYQ